MKGYKAFGKGLVCRGKQYQENTVFEEEKAEICESGMHFCEKPLEVLEHYPLVNEKGEMSEFAEVEALDEVLTNDNKKFCTKKLKIGAKISFAKLVQASVEFEMEKGGKEKIHDKDDEIIVSKSRSAQIGSSGDSAKIGSSGYSAQIGSSGDYAKIGSSGDYAQIGSSGYSAKIGSSGDYAQIGSSGYSAKIGSSGDSAQIGSSGDYAKINSTGKYAVVCCAGHDCVAKGKIGSWLTLSEWKYSKEEKAYIPVCVRTEKIDGIKVKEDVYYKLIDGVFVEQ